VTRRAVAVAAVAIALSACGGDVKSTGKTAATDPPLRIRDLRASVVRMGSSRGEPLYGVRLRADTCARSRAEALRIFPTAFRVAHFVTRTPKAANWGRPFRIMTNDLYWIVPFGETGRLCSVIELGDVVPADNYQGVESALGYLRGRCYGVHVRVDAILESSDRKRSTPISAGRRTVVQCARFGPR
jgi:hypothetical protein